MVAIAQSVSADTLRLRHEFLEMPGLTLTGVQAARLLSVSARTAIELLDALAAEGFLVGDGAQPQTYRRGRNGASSRKH